MSRILIIFASLLLAPAAFALHFDVDGFAQSLGGWEDKRASRVKYAWSGSNFRTYRPVTTRTPEGGAFVTAQIHKVGVSTDVCVLEMTFDSDGNVIAAQAKIRMGRRAYDTALVKPDPVVAPTEPDPAAPPVAPLSEQIATELFKKLDAEVAKWNETLTGQKTRKDLIGRLTQSSRQTENIRVNFSGAVRHNFNLIASSMRQGGPYVEK
ncbi:MAG: hypothetical protein O3C21_17620 [Verrucomicrobia bacterium]|nr:hypothetical protein [Verrucomicrobiota bacterium]